MALDPLADAGRKVWLPCSHCPNADGLYLLKADAKMVYVQCPLCHNSWWLDTGCGAGRRPEYVEGPPSWPS